MRRAAARLDPCRGGIVDAIFCGGEHSANIPTKQRKLPRRRVFPQRRHFSTKLTKDRSASLRAYRKNRVELRSHYTLFEEDFNTINNYNRKIAMRELFRSANPRPRRARARHGRRFPSARPRVLRFFRRQHGRIITFLRNIPNVCSFSHRLPRTSRPRYYPPF